MSDEESAVFTEEDDRQPVTVLVYGPPKVGKTHWALHRFPSPVWVIDTERRTAMVASKARADGATIRVARCSKYEDVRAAAKAVFESGETDGTVVFDSASDLRDMAEDFYLRQTQSDKIYPKVVWGRVFRLIDRPFWALKRKGLNVVFVCREKDEYRGDKTTGKRTFEGYKKLPYLSDVVLRHVGPHLEIHGNGIRTGDVNSGKLDTSRSWEDLLEDLRS